MPPRDKNKEANDLRQIAFGYKMNEQNFESLIAVKKISRWVQNF